MWAGCACVVQAHEQIGNTELDHFLQSNKLQGKKTYALIFAECTLCTFCMITLCSTYFFLTPRSENGAKNKQVQFKYFCCLLFFFFLKRNDWIAFKNICSLPPIRLASEESRSPPMVLVAGGVAGGAAATPVATGVPLLPAVLPAVLPPVLCGVTAGISKSPNPPNTWVEGAEVTEGRWRSVPDRVVTHSAGRCNSRLLSEGTIQLLQHQLAVPHMHNTEDGCGYISALGGTLVELGTCSLNSALNSKQSGCFLFFFCFF